MKNKTFNILGVTFLSIGLISACFLAAGHSNKKSDSATKADTYTATISEYYADMDWDETGATLKTSLFGLIGIENAGWSYDGLFTAYKTTDTRSDGTVWDIYSDKTKYTHSTSHSSSTEGGGFNREHMIPQSIFNEAAPMKSDIHHVFPSDCYVNNRRSNFPHGNTNKSVSYTSNDGYKLGYTNDGNYSGQVFEPKDAYKGDIARTYFYFVTCYQDKLSSFDSFGAFSKNTYPSIAEPFLSVYLQWAKDDPVSQKEIDRNNAAYAGQGNRNPFIDYPYAIGAIWDSTHASNYGSKTTYSDGTPVAFTGLSISKTSVSLTENETTTIKATTSDSSSINWTTSNSDAVTLSKSTSNSGEYITLTAVGEGASTITASATVDITYYEKTCNVTVTASGGSGGDPDPVTPGDSETIDMTAQGFSNNQEITSISGTNCTVTFSQASGTNSPKYFTSGTAVRAYAKNTITVSSTNNIVGITFTFGSDDGSNAITSNCGTFSSPTWTGTANSVTFTIGGSSGNRRIASIDVTYEGSGGTDPTPVTPTLSSISLDITNVQTEFIVGDTFTYTGLVVTAHYSDESSKTVTPTSVSTPDMATTGAKTVTVSYTENEVTKQDTYSINVSAAPTSNWVISSTAYKTALFGSSYNSKGVGSYTDSWSSTNQGFTVDLENANNNNNGWSYIKMGSNKAASTGTITTDAVIDKPIGKVRITIDAITTNNITSITLYSSSNNSSWSSVGTFDKASGSQEVTIDEPAKNLYYKIEVVCTKSSSNGTITISKVEYFNASISADAWGTNFLSLITCNNGETAPNVTNWGKTKTSYDELLSSEQSKVLAAQPNESGSDLQKAIARYVYIVNKYKNRTNYPDYLSKASGSNTMSKYTNDINMNAVLIVICVMSTFSGLACFAFKYKKKYE